MPPTMKTLLDDRYAPITSTVGFFEAPLADAADALYTWRATLHRNVSRTVATESFPKVLHRLEPLTIGFWARELLLPTQSSWTAYFNNHLHGTDAFPPVSHLCRVRGWRGLVVSCIPHTFKGRSGNERGRYGIVRFELYGPEETEWLNFIRAVVVLSDVGGWEFHTVGPVLPFEQPERYAEQRKRDRFTPEMLDDYCRALGVHYFDPGFYGDHGVLIEVLAPYPKPGRTLSLSEVQQELNIQTGDR